MSRWKSASYGLRIADYLNRQDAKNAKARKGYCRVYYTLRTTEMNGRRSMRLNTIARLSSFVLSPSFVLWTGAALIVSLLLLRFGMRALGVRPDIVIPGFVYGLTDPLVLPFYRFFPLPAPYGARFDTPVIETASLGAAGVVCAAALAIYLVGLLIIRLQSRQAR
jgi:hypothetical protein